MTYRILIRPKWTTFNNNPTNKWVVQYLVLGILWVSTRDTWHTKPEAEQYIKDTRKEY